MDVYHGRLRDILAEVMNAAADDVIETLEDEIVRVNANIENDSSESEEFIKGYLAALEWAKDYEISIQ